MKLKRIDDLYFWDTTKISELQSISIQELYQVEITNTNKEEKIEAILFCKHDAKAGAGQLSVRYL